MVCIYIVARYSGPAPFLSVYTMYMYMYLVYKDADFQQVLESLKVASFGRGKETVTDKSYRDAYVLEPDQFLSSFQLSDTDILREDRSILVPDVQDVRAELYLLQHVVIHKV